MSTYVDSIKTITGKDPLQNKALKCYNTIQSNWLLHKTKLKKAEGKTNKRRVFFKLQRTSSHVPCTAKKYPPIPSYSIDCLHISSEGDLLPIFME
jgi:hypothetical protein